MRVAVLTSGGDAPGMNAAIRAVTRTAIFRGWEVYGIQRGFKGLMDGAFVKLGVRDVGGIIGCGGTMLGSSRSKRFMSSAGKDDASRQLSEYKIDALIVIGGNGSQKGAFSLFEMGFPVVGIASTIDNDLYGSDVTIGVDTALNVALEAIDRIRVTASSHRRVFALEVMGRDCGYLALMAGIAGGAEIIIIPEIEFDIQKMTSDISEFYQKGKPHAIIVVSEGAYYNAEGLTRYFSGVNTSSFEIRTTVLGYVQRGASPGFSDRILATRLGVSAIDTVADRNFGVLIGIQNDNTITTPLEVVSSRKKELDHELFRIAGILSK